MVLKVLNPVRIIFSRLAVFFDQLLLLLHFRFAAGIFRCLISIEYYKNGRRLCRDSSKDSRTYSEHKLEIRSTGYISLTSTCTFLLSFFLPFLDVHITQDQEIVMFHDPHLGKFQFIESIDE